jgi:hypothetical protein
VRKPKVDPHKPAMVDGIQPLYQARCFKKTEDDWAPSFGLAGLGAWAFNRVDTQLVEVSLYPPYGGTGLSRVCVWGADDFGMERDFSEATDAQRIFLHLIQMSFVNQADLLKLNFVRC